MSTADTRIAIAGAGLVGSLLAVIMAKRGHHVSVFERRNDPRAKGFIGGRSINLALSDRGWKALELAGVADQVRELAIPMHGRMMHATDGALTFQPYGKQGQAIYSVPRGGLNKLLLELADQHERVELHFGRSVNDLELDTATLHLSSAEGAHETLQFDRIFGTDGAFSAVRNRMVRLDRFNYEQRYLTHGYKELSIAPNPDGSHQLETHALHIWPRGEYMLIALPNPDGSFTCTLFFPYEGEVSFAAIQTNDDVRKFMETNFADAAALIPDYVEQWHTNPTSSLVMISCDPWNYADKVCLLGDASHAIVPFYGQGMNSGFEDCSVLCEILDGANGDWHAAFHQFSSVRKPQADAIRELALRNYIEMRDKTADPAFLLQKKIEAHFSERHPDKWIPLYSQVTFSHIPYDEALHNGLVQDAIMKRVMNRHDIETMWNSEEVERAILNEIEALRAAHN
jgi:kynurenine 3-monooxygenase